MRVSLPSLFRFFGRVRRGAGRWLLAGVVVVAPQPASGYPRCYPREGHLRREEFYIFNLDSYMGANIVVAGELLRSSSPATKRTGYPQPPCVKNTMNYPQLTEKISHLE